MHRTRKHTWPCIAQLKVLTQETPFDRTGDTACGLRNSLRNFHISIACAKTTAHTQAELIITCMWVKYILVHFFSCHIIIIIHNLPFNSLLFTVSWPGKKYSFKSNNCWGQVRTFPLGLLTMHYTTEHLLIWIWQLCIIGKWLYFSSVFFFFFSLSGNHLANQCFQSLLVSI